MDFAVDILRRGKGLHCMVGNPQVAQRQTRGTGEFGRVKVRFEPGEPGSGCVFANKAGPAVPADFVPGVAGLADACEQGPIAGLPLMDIATTLIDGDYHDVDSNARTFEIAARACLREALPKASPRILEPIMKVEVVTPQDYVGDAIGDLNSRSGQVQGMDSRGNAQVISAMLPLANLFGYPSALWSMTQGRAQCTMHFDHCEPVPPAAGPGDGDFPMAAALRW